MSIIKKAKDKGIKEIIKYKIKSFLNQKFKFNGKYDEKIDKVSDKAIDAITVDNIMKARKKIDKVKNQK